MESPGQNRKIVSSGSNICKILFSEQEQNVLLTLFIFIGTSGTAAVARFQTVVLAVQITVQTRVDVQVGVTVQKNCVNCVSIYVFLPKLL